MIRTNKDILLGYISTLNDNECRDIYYKLVDKEFVDANLLKFDKVTLSNVQYNKLIWGWGKDKTDKCIGILNDWLSKRNENLKHFSCYKHLTGWVENKYYQLYPLSPDDKSLLISNNPTSKEKAIAYIKCIPKELWKYDSDVKFLVSKFEINLLTDMS